MILANITIYQCDECGAIITLKTEAEYSHFENNWHDGLLYQFCGDCKNLPRIQSKLFEEQRRMTALLQSQKGDVLDAEFIN